MEKKKIYITDNEDNIEYVATIGDRKIKFDRSNSEAWSSHVKGERVATLKDDGNGVKITMDKFDTYLDYSDFVSLFELLKLKMSLESNMSPDYKYLKD